MEIVWWSCIVFCNPLSCPFYHDGVMVTENYGAFEENRNSGRTLANISQRYGISGGFCYYVHPGTKLASGVPILHGTKKKIPLRCKSLPDFPVSLLFLLEWRSPLTILLPFFRKSFRSFFMIGKQTYQMPVLCRESSSEMVMWTSTGNKGVPLWRIPCSIF